MSESTEWGIVKRIGRHEDRKGRQVLRAIVEFYDGNGPSFPFKVVWDRVPVKIVPQTTAPPQSARVTDDPLTGTAST